MGEYVEELRSAELLQKVSSGKEPSISLLAVYSCLGTALINMGRYSDAEEKLREVERMGNELYGEDAQNTDTAITHQHWGKLLRLQGKYQEAQKHLQQAIEIEEKLTHSQDRKSSLGVAYILNELALSLKAEGSDLPSAHEYARRALAIRQAKLREKHPRIAESFQTLAEVLLVQGDLNNTRQNLEAALFIRKAKFGDDNSLTAESLHTLALLTAAEEKYSEADNLLRQALAVRETKLGPDHPLTQASRQELAAIEKYLPQT
jgi:tetratricopeptide (TPR) repeat protein